MTTALARKTFVDALSDAQRAAINAAMPITLGRPALRFDADDVAWLVYDDPRADADEIRSVLAGLGISEDDVKVED